MKIYINAGHGLNTKGGKDPGAIGRVQGLHEHDAAWDMAERLGNLLRANGHETVGPFLRNINTAAEEANRHKCDLVISLHCNSAVDTSAHGFEVLYKTNESRRIAEAIAAQVKAQIPTGKSQWLKETGKIPLTLRAGGTGIVHRPKLGILRLPKCKAILIEAAFISNPREEELLGNRFFKQALMQCVADAIGEA